MHCPLKRQIFYRGIHSKASSIGHLSTTRLFGRAQPIEMRATGSEWMKFFFNKNLKKKERQTRSAFFNYFFWLWNHSGCIVVIFFPRLDRMKKKACGGTCVSSITRPLISSFSEPTKKKKKKRTKVRKTFSPPNDFRQLETLSSENDAVYSLNSFTAQNKSKLEFKSTGTALWPHVEVEPI